MTRPPRPPVPPRLARLLLALWFGEDAREVVRGDLDELFAAGLGAGATPRAARRAYWRATLASLRDTRPGEGRGFQGSEVPRFGRSGGRGAAFVGGFGADLRHTLRGLAKSPGFATVAILSLAIGIGANTSIFSVIRSVLLTELQVDRPGELRLVHWSSPREYRISNYSSSGSTDPDTGVRLGSNVTYPQYAAMRAAAPAEATLFGFNFVRQVSVTVGDDPAVVGGGLLVSADFFAGMRLPVALGRALGPADDRPGAPAVAVISHAFWQRAFGGAPDVLDAPVRVNGHPVTIVGVTPAGYRGLSPGGFFPPTDVTLTFACLPIAAPGWAPPGGSAFESTERAWVRVGARVPAGMAEGPLADALSSVLRRSVAEHSPEAAAGVDQVAARLLPGARGIDTLRRDTERPLAILSAVVGLVLLIACANLASLLLARGAFRQQELSVRRALGASRARLVRQLLLESAVLATAGGAAGLALAWWSGRAITTAITAGLGPVAVGFALDRQVLLVALSVSVLAALLCGTLPALRLSRTPDGGDLRERGATPPAARQRLGRALIALQIAASIPLLVGAGLLLRTAGNLGAVDLGYDPDGLVFFRVDTALVDDGPARAASIFEQVVDRVGRIPGVDRVSLIENVPLSGWTSSRTITVDGEEHPGTMNAGGPELFATLGVTLVAGRDLDTRDRAGAPRVVVINESAAREWFGGNALGRRIEDLGDDGAEVVGVVPDTRYARLRDDFSPTFYDAAAQRGSRAMHVVFRTALPPASLESQVREAVASVDRLLPVTDYRSQVDEIATSLGRDRVITRLLVVFGGFALFLACLGLHGLTTYTVAQRTGEIGIRLALGARRPQIVWLLVRQVLLIALAGLALGVPVALRAATVVESMLFGLAPTDPVTVAGAAMVMLLVALAAGWLPARRAARMDPLGALRI